MSGKSTKRLIHQLGRVRGVQKRYSGLSMTITQASKQLVEMFRAELGSFDAYEWTLTEKSVEEMCADGSEPPIFLSPDAENPPLMELPPNRRLIIGGLVDETGAGPLTLGKARMCFMLRNHFFS